MNKKIVFLLCSLGIINPLYSVKKEFLTEKQIELLATKEFYKEQLFKSIKENNIKLFILLIGNEWANPQDPLLIDTSKISPLHYALSLHRNKIVYLLISCNVDIEARTLQGHSPLFYAVKHNNLVGATMLLGSGVDPFSVGALRASFINYPMSREMYQLVHEYQFPTYDLETSESLSNLFGKMLLL